MIGIIPENCQTLKDGIKCELPIYAVSMRVEGDPL
jgi:hypothetical protein